MSEINIDVLSDNDLEWKRIMKENLSKASSFRIHIWNEEVKEEKLALKFGRLVDYPWSYGKVIEGEVTPSFCDFILSLPKPPDSEIYNKMTPFFSIFLDNGFCSEHYGTELYKLDKI